MQRTYLGKALMAFSVAGLMIGVASAQNALINAGFEDGPLTNDGPPFVGFWESFSLDGDQDTGGDTVRIESNTPLSGANHVEMIIGDGIANSFAGLFQDVAGLSAGQAFEYSGWHRSFGNNGGVEIRIEWRDSVGDVEISRTPNLTPTLTTSYTQFQFLETVPAGADSARVVYAIQSFGGVTDQRVLVDDFFATPEPGTLSMLALAGLALIRRR